MKQKITLKDGSFPHQFSATLGNERDHEQPNSFIWSSESYGSQYTFYTDMKLSESIGKRGKKVAWLLEPPSLSHTHYDYADAYQDEFDYVLSFDRTFLKRIPEEKALWYPLGGSWIKEHRQGIPEKTKNTCIIVSEKKGAEGHRKRHDIVKYLSRQVDVYGRGYRPFPLKSDVLAPYRYAIIVESWKGESYFSEKLIDAISMGCVPIYLGCPDIGNYFDTVGILRFETITRLYHILERVVSPHDYEMRINAIEKNFFTAKHYQCAEDWIYAQYRFLFT